jgi:NAD(P)-dependent dehydrogenase (short-subunit alcohol dehydrogenase family)
MNENSQAQIIVITGAGSGFGRTTAIELARAGHNVYASMLVADLEGERSASLRSVASEERLDLRPLKLDVREEASCRAAVDRILADEGRVDVAMNNAAMMMHGITEAFRPEQVLQILDLNAVAWLRVNRAVLPAMRQAGKGLLIYTGSGINRLPTRGDAGGAYRGRPAGLADRRFDEVAPGVQEATGIAPRSFLDFASACGEMFSASIA